MDSEHTCLNFSQAVILQATQKFTKSVPLHLCESVAYMIVADESVAYVTHFNYIMCAFKCLNFKNVGKYYNIML